jgi:predicted kinase
MAKLVIIRGLPGCGKSTQAREWVEESPDSRAEVNRDAIRLMLGGYTVGSAAQEKMVTKVQHQAIHDLLKAGVDVISSDTNLPAKFLRELYRIAYSVGAEVTVHDMTDVPIGTVLERNKNRKDKEPVPTPVIMKMYNNNIKGQGYPLPLPDLDSAGKAPDFYYGEAGLPVIDISDIDGTVASCEGVRSPYDYSRVSFDRPRKSVIDVLHDRNKAGKGLIFMSGRPDINNVRRDTEEWIRTYIGLPYETLLMRPADRLQIDDAIIKRDLFDEHIRGRYNIGVVLDDRDRVVNMWRRQLGLDCLQVNYGDF